MDKAKVLVVVEDEPDVRLLIRAALSVDPRIEIAGEASSAHEALEIAQTNELGLIILDHSLNGPVTGLDVAPQLKEVAPNASILLFSAFDLAERSKHVDAVDEFLSKSRFNELLPTVQRLLGLPPQA